MHETQWRTDIFFRVFTMLRRKSFEHNSSPTSSSNCLATKDPKIIQIYSIRVKFKLFWRLIIEVYGEVCEVE